jgi:uncharacterized membrane protein YbhN (UPF0104 family)
MALVSLLVAAGFGYLLHKGALPVVPRAAAFDGIAWWTVASYAVIWVAVLLLRSYRWKWLLRPISEVPTSKVLAVSLITAGALIVLPLRMGEVVRPALIRGRQPSGGQVSGWEATGTVAAERVLDGLTMSVLLFAALLLARPLDPLPDRIGDLPVPVSLVPRTTYFALGLFACAFVTLGLFYFARDKARRATLLLVGLVSTRAANYLAAKVEQIANGLSFLPRTALFLPFLAMTLGYWLLNAAGIWLLCQGGAVPISFVQAVVLMGVLALGVLLPNAPGYFGAFQLSLYAGFAMYLEPGVVVAKASVVIFLMYLVQILGTLIPAAAALWWYQRAPWRLQEAHG